MVKFITLSGSITLLVDLLHYREVLHYREFITLLEQNVTIDIIISRYSSTFYGCHFENRYLNPNGHI